jgi:hypothetical protein
MADWALTWLATRQRIDAQYDMERRDDNPSQES